MSSLFTGVVNVLIDYRWVWAFLWGAVALVGAIWAHDLPVDRRVDRLLSPTNPAIQSYQTLGRVFGAYDPIVVAYDDPALMNPGGAGIERIRRLEAFLDELPGIVETISLADMDALAQETLR